MKIKEVMTEVTFLTNIEKSCTQIIQIMDKYEDMGQLENIKPSGEDTKSEEFMYELEQILKAGADFYVLISTLKSLVVDKRIEYQSALDNIDIPNLKPVR